MNTNLSTGMLGTVASMTLLAAAAAIADSATLESDVQHAIDSLRAEIAALRASNAMDASASLDEARARQIRGLVQDVLADADGRASLRGAGATAGWDKGFFLTSPDGNFRLDVKGYVQFRWIGNDVRDPGLESWQSGFENARTQLFFEGHVVDKSLTYRIQGNYSRSGGSLTLFDAWIAKSFGNGLKLVAGQFRDPMLREFMVVETAQLAVERSLVHQAFTFDRTQGVLLEYQNDLLRLQGSFNDGSKSSNSPWQQATTEYAFTGRGELRFGGAWAQFNDLTSAPGEPLAAMLGAAIGWQRAEAGAGLLGTEIVQWTTDLSVEFGGANLFAAVVGRHSADTPSGDLDQFGVVGQGGCFVLPKVELFARYEWGDADNDSDDLSVATAGVNWYLLGQRLKFTADVGYGFNAVSAFFGNPSSIAGWRTDSGGDDGQVVARLQAQLMF